MIFPPRAEKFAKDVILPAMHSGLDQYARVTTRWLCPGRASVSRYKQIDDFDVYSLIEALLARQAPLASL